MNGEPTNNSGLKITRQMLGNARAGLGECLHCRSILADAKALGLPMPEIERQIDEWQPRFEGIIGYDAASKGLSNEKL